MATALLLSGLAAACASAASSSSSSPSFAPPVAPELLSALRSSEQAAFRADLSSSGSFASAAGSAAVRRAERFRSSLQEGRLRAGPTVSTIYGSLTGVTSANVTQFLGVPFAQPPVGDLRWKAPAKPAAWGSRNATWWGNTCPQSEANTWGLFTGNAEDCLNLDIYMPSRTPPAGGWPVMVFFYGGSFTCEWGGWV